MLLYKYLYDKKHIMNPDNLAPTSTDMCVNMLGNTDKMVSSNKRVMYPVENNVEELDVDPMAYIKEPVQNIFTKPEPVKSSSPNDSVFDNTNKLNSKELMLQKLNMLRKLGELKQYGVQLTQNYSINSDYEMMEYEYNLHHDIRSKQNAVQWMSHMMIGIIKGTEMINDTYNPFDIKLEGRVSDKISSDMQSYYAVLGDIYEKYNQPGKQWAPELRLLFMICGVAVGTQMNKIIPGFGGLENVVNSPATINELRKKASEDTNKNANDYTKKLHTAASQKAADLKMIQDKEIEAQKLEKIMNATSDEIKKIQDNLILSSELPQHARKQPNTSPPNTTQPKNNAKPNIFTNTNKINNLNQHNKELDDILATLNTKQPQQDSISSSAMSKKSTISINKNMSTIMKNTKKQPIIDNIQFDKQIQDLLDNNSKESISIGSSKKSRENINYADMGISIGSNIKGQKINITTG